MRFGCLALIGLSLLAAVPAQAQTGAQPAPVVVDEARLVMMAPTMQVAGTVLSRSDATLSAEVEGRLVEVAEVGGRFSRGDVLARVEDAPLELRARELEAEIDRAEARLAFLEAELKRYQQLAESKLASPTQVDQTRSERDIAAADLAMARARLDQVRDQIERARIRAPFDGIVARRLAQPGERVAVGSAVLRVYDPSSLEIVARAPLDYYRFLAPGDELSVQVSGRSIMVPLRTLVSQGNENVHVFEIRLDLDEALPVGQTVRVTIPTAELREVIAVPRDALVLRGDGASVYVVDEQNTARRMQVDVGIASGELIEVRGPIQPGDRVVIRGNERLRAGQPVQVVGQGAPATMPGPA